MEVVTAFVGKQLEVRDGNSVEKSTIQMHKSILRLSS